MRTESVSTSLHVVAFAALLVTVGCQPAAEQADTRQAEVAARGANVMPFDLDRSTHFFDKLDGGGQQRVVSDDNDAEQIRLIREHLAEEAERFSRGDFHDPEMIHGSDMAGIHALTTGYERLSVEYSDIDGGGQIDYSSEDPALVTALHQWFDQQVSDHGQHAGP